jgi:bifunctional NMN adenylyltransferase/nudix hydrolase
MKTTGVIVARFQTPYLHQGHRTLIDDIRASHNKIIAVIGITAVKASKRNPFDFYTREKMLRQYLPDMVVLPLSDHSSDITWSDNLDALLKSAFPHENFVLYGSRDSFIPYYSGVFEVKQLPAAGQYSSTTIRQDEADKVLGSVDFRLGVNYALQNGFPKTYTTVDIAVLSGDGKQVLLGKKHGATQWRFPGGFTDPTDDNYEASARRELMEECGSIETGAMQYVGSAKIDDWRYRSEEDKIITLLYKTHHVYGNPKAADDIEAVKWVDVADIEGMMTKKEITAEHVVLVKMLLENLK